jgi:hypothetical protein
MKRFGQIFIAFVIFLLFFSAIAHGATWSKKRGSQILQVTLGHQQ